MPPSPPSPYNLAVSLPRRTLVQWLVVAALVAAGVAFLTWRTGGTFLMRGNLASVARRIAEQAIVAAGVTMVIIAGGIDLSVASVMQAAGVAAFAVVKAGGPDAGGAWVAAGAAAALAVGGLVGLVNGTLTTRFGIAPFIATLSTMAIVAGLARVVTGARPVYLERMPAALDWLGRGMVLQDANGVGIPVPALIMAGVLSGAAVLLHRTKLGRWIYAVGGNEEAARLSGVPVAAVRTFTYLVTGVLAGLAGLLLAARLGSGDPKTATGWELTIIAACVVGGTSLAGGKGTILGTFLGALLIGVLENAQNLLGIGSFWHPVTLGCVILLAVLADRLARGR